MENQIPQVPTANSPQTTAEQSEKAVVRSPLAMSSVVIIILSILLLLSLSATGYFYYQLQKVNNDLRILNDELTQKQIQITTPTTEPTVTDETANWKTYTSTKYKNSFKYPEGWVVKEDDNPPQITISKGQYSIVSSYPEAFGPGICIFEDSVDFNKDVDGPIEKCSGKFVTIKSIDMELRRRLTSEVNGEKFWTIYSKEKTNGYFVTVPPVTYKTPINYDEEILKEMDKIFSTFKSTNSPL